MSDIIGMAFSIGFGLLVVIFPESVNKFYVWFHKGKFKGATTKRVRNSGLVWIVFMIIFFISCWNKMKFK